MPAYDLSRPAWRKARPRAVLSGGTFNVHGCIAEPGALIYHPIKSEEALARLQAGIAALAR